MPAERKLAVVTGASSGIGYELARCAAEDGCDLIITSDEDSIEEAATQLRVHGVSVHAIKADLSRQDGIATLWAAMQDRPVDYLMAHAGRGLGDAFLDQSWDRIAEVILLNVIGTTDLLHRSLQAILGRGPGRILITGSIAGDVPGSYQAVYNATKAYVDILAWGIRNELKGDDVTVTCLMPGPTETPIFTRQANDLAQTPIARSTNKDDPEMVARAGYKAMMQGERGVIPGWTNRIAAMLSGLLPQDLLAAVHRRGADPSR